jgi:hypothetical protein
VNRNSRNNPGMMSVHTTQKIQSEGPEWPASSMRKIGSSFHRTGVSSIATIHPPGKPITIAKTIASAVRMGNIM